MDKEFAMAQATKLHAKLEELNNRVTPFVIGVHDMIWALEHGRQLTQEEKKTLVSLRLIYGVLEAANNTLEVAHSLAKELS